MAKPRVAAIIQARMGSTRLPGKVLMPLAGKPVLWHVIHRLQRCETVDVVAIATSDKPGDDALVPFAAELGVPLVRGPEEHVLARFAIAAEQLSADYIVRVTGDAPLVDPETIDLLVRELIARDADYCVGESSRKTIHEGFDPCSRRALDRLVAEAWDDSVAREHVTAYFKEHPEFARLTRVTLPPGYEVEGVRASVDTPADLLFLETLHQKLGAAPGEIDVKQAVQLLHREPGLKRINGHVRQKAAAGQYGRMLIRCDAGPQIGLGHVTRCLALAAELRELHGIGVSFALSEDGVGTEMVRQQGFPADIRPADADEAEWIDGLIRAYSPRAAILDIRTGLEGHALRRWRATGITVAVVDDPSDRRLAADLAFYPPVPQLAEVAWDGFNGAAHIGWDYVLLRREFGNVRRQPGGETPVILVTMGGSDPAGLTLLALDALEQIREPFRAEVVLGKAFLHEQSLHERRQRLPERFRFVRDAQDMPSRMARADLALAAFGGTAYELVAVGVPSLLLSLSPDHAHSAQALADAGMAISLGDYRQIGAAQLADAVRDLLAQPQRRQDLSAACTAVDGRGAERIARLLVERSEPSHG